MPTFDIFKTYVFSKVQIMQKRALYIRYHVTIIVKSTDIEN